MHFAVKNRAALIGMLKAMTDSQRPELRLSAEHLSKVKLALRQRREKLADDEPTAPVSDEGVDLVVPATSAQTGLWFLDQYQQGRAVYSVSSALRLAGRLDIDALNQALTDLIVRHSALRTTLRYVDDTLQQHICGNPEDCWALEQSGQHVGDSAAETTQLLQDRIALWCQQPFDLAAGPLFRVLLLNIAKHDHALVLNAHHAITDGWSQNVLMGDLVLAYNARLVGEVPSFDGPANQYHELVQRANQAADKQVSDARLERWHELLAGIPDCHDLPTDVPRPSERTSEGARDRCTFNGEQTQLVRELAKRHQTTPFCILLSALKLVLLSQSDQSHVVVGVPVAGRPRRDYENAIGYFTNTVPVATPVAKIATVSEFIGAVHDRLLSSLELQETPFQELVEHLNPPRSLAWHPIYQVAFSLQPQAMGSRTFNGLEQTTIKRALGTSRFDLALFGNIGDDSIQLELEYSVELFHESTVARWLRGLAEAVEFMAKTDEKPIGRFKIALARVEPDVRGATPGQQHNPTIPEAFAKVLKQYPDKIALVVPGPDGTVEMTYSELDQRSSDLAVCLASEGDLAGEAVAMCLPRGVGSVVTMLAIVRAGGAYLPLIDTEPDDQLYAQLSDSAAKTLVLNATDAHRLADSGARRILLPEDANLVGDSGSQPTEVEFSEGGTKAEPGMTSEYPACILYTSGSTGTPKGVQVPHRAVIRLVSNARFANLGPDHVMLHMASLAFDAATLEVWGPLLNGGTCVVYPHALPDPVRLEALVREQGVTTGWFTSSLFNALVDEAPESLAGFRQILTGGEALSVAHIARAQQRLPEVELINGYGPTENGTFTTTYTIPAGFSVDSASVPIGKPIAATSTFVLNEKMQRVAIGEPGELWVGGDGVALGYLNKPDDTRFQQVPSLAAGKLYRTGDLVRERHDGNLEFIGRRDSQIKLNGFRVELGEVEAKLRALPAIRDAAVALVERNSERQLAAFVIPEGDGELSAEQLSQQLSKSIVSYKIPQIFEPVSKLPLGANGKVDRDALVASGGHVTTSTYMHSDTRRSTKAESESIESGGLSPASAVTEAELLGIWQDALSQPDLQATDDFFGAGGHSLLAVRLMGRLQSLLGRDLPLSTLFQAPTVRQFTAVLNGTAVPRQSDRADEWSALVPIRSEGHLPPLFLVHALGGQVHGFQEFVQHLEEGQPVYGVQSFGYVDGQAPHFDMVSMAAAYVRQIRKLQPNGPYFLGGISLGGLIAFEMTAQLERQGQRVAFLLIGDTAFTRGAHIEPANRWLARWLRYLPMPRAWASLMRWRRRQKEPSLSSAQSSFRATLASEPLFAARHQLVVAAHHQALLSYEPISVDAPITLMVADSFPLSRAALYRLTGGGLFGWDRLTRGEVSEFTLRGNHHEMFYGENSKDFAKTLSAALASNADLQFARALGNVIPISVEQRSPSPIVGPQKSIESTRMPAVALEQTRIAPCSSAQQRAWFIQRLEPESRAWNTASIFRLTGSVDVGALQQSIDWLVERHEPLRTTFELRDTAPIQVIHPVMDVPLIRESLPSARRPADEEILTAEAEAKLKHGFDLEVGPMVRPILTELGADDYLLVIVFHHLVTDGWSLDVMKTDLTAAYAAFSERREPTRERLEFGYSEVIARRTETDSADSEALGYWLEYLRSPIQKLTLCKDGDPELANSASGFVEFTLMESDQEQVAKFAATHGVSPFCVLLSVFNVLFMRLGGDSDVVLGLPTHGRQSSTSLDLIGYFANTLVVRNEVSGQANFADLCAQVWANLTESMRHENVQFETLVNELVEHRSLDDAPFFNVMINGKPADIENHLHFDGVCVEERALSQHESKYDLTVYLQDNGDTYLVRAVYRRKSHSKAAIEALMEQFVLLLGRLCRSSDLPLSQFSLVTQSASERLPAPTAGLVKSAFRGVAQQFLDAAQVHSKSPAMITASATYSYSQVQSMALGWARSLQVEGVTTGSVVGIFGRPTETYWTAALGVLLNGDVLLLLDYRQPSEALASQLSTANPVAICVTEGDELPPALRGSAICVNAPLEETTENDLAGLADIDPGAPAYLFFTSGSTGLPKAVLGRHDSLQNFLDWERDHLQLVPTDRVAQVTSPSFDVVLRDFLLPLTSGAALVVPPMGVGAGERAALEWLSGASVSVLHTVPSIMRTWLAVAGSDIHLPKLRVVLSAGEPLRGELVNDWRARFGDAGRIVNLYGCTESTLAQSFFDVPVQNSPAVLPVGKGVPGAQLLVCSADGQQCGIHEPGEVVVRTLYPSLGYWVHSSLDNSIFSHATPDGAVRYATGDQGYYTPAGDVVVTGRSDSQLKIRGVRVQLNTVAAWVESRIGVARCVGMAVNDAHGEKALCLFVVSERQLETAASSGVLETLVASADREELDWQEQLRKQILHHAPPGYLPAQLISLARIPLLPNGKTDIMALRELARGIASAASQAPACDAPQGEFSQVGQTVHDIWSKALALPQISVSASFFSLGGHSLLLPVLAYEIEEQLGVGVSLRELYAHITLAEQISLVEEALVLKG